jgi:phage shock protein C
MKTHAQKITRSHDRVIAGVIGGFADYYDVEPTLLRLAAVFMAVATGLIPALVTYGVAVVLVPGASHPRSSDLAAPASPGAE